MSDQQGYKQDKTYVRETRTTERTGGGMALLVGGLVVAVAFILWLVFGGTEPAATTIPRPTSSTRRGLCVLGAIGMPSCISSSVAPRSPRCRRKAITWR